MSRRRLSARPSLLAIRIHCSQAWACPRRCRRASRMAGRRAWIFSGAALRSLQEQGNEELLVDAETREARVTLQGAITDRIAWQLQVPYRYTGGGNLDGFIDSWHDFFGLAEGARPLLPRDQTNIVYARSGVRDPDIRSSASGLADIQAALGYSVHASADSAMMAWLSVKLPTGDEDKLTGNGATDVSLLVSGQHRLSDRWSAFGQAGGNVARRKRPASDRTARASSGAAMAGVSVAAWRGLSLKAQIDAHTAASIASWISSAKPSCSPSAATIASLPAGDWTSASAKTSRWSTPRTWCS